MSHTFATGCKHLRPCTLEFLMSALKFSSSFSCNSKMHLRMRSCVLTHSGGIKLCYFCRICGLKNRLVLRIAQMTQPSVSAQDTPFVKHFLFLKRIWALQDVNLMKCCYKLVFTYLKSASVSCSGRKYFYYYCVLHIIDLSATLFSMWIKPRNGGVYFKK